MSTAELSSLLVSQSYSLHPFAVSLTQDKDTARDLCQDTIYRALKNIDKYQIGTNIKSWLYTIMRNIFINDYRKKKRQPVISGDETMVHHSAPASYDTYDLLAKKELDQVIYHLPPVFRTSFLLYVEGYKYHEIADMLHEPLGTIKSRIHFARKVLKKQIQQN
jgi:RNA polymerase sigma-70 factor (ECF subfamily)